MKKFIELLNEYEKEKTNQNVRFWNYYQNWFHYLEDGQSYSELLIISKKYEFIKWLVENNKIDLKEFHRLCWIINQDSEYWNCTPQDYEQVIMYLSISDSPIEDLVSILK